MTKFKNLYFVVFGNDFTSIKTANKLEISKEVYKALSALKYPTKRSINKVNHYHKVLMPIVLKGQILFLENLVNRS